MVFGLREQSFDFVGGLWRFGAWVVVLDFWLLGLLFGIRRVFAVLGLDGSAGFEGILGCFFLRILGNSRVDLSLGDALDERRFEAC